MTLAENNFSATPVSGVALRQGTVNKSEPWQRGRKKPENLFACRGKLLQIFRDAARQSRSIFSSVNPSAPQPASQKLFVIAKRCGRLGNQLVQFANFIGYAEEHGHRVANTTFAGYSTPSGEASASSGVGAFPSAPGLRNWLRPAPSPGSRSRAWRTISCERRD